MFLSSSIFPLRFGLLCALVGVLRPFLATAPAPFSHDPVKVKVCLRFMSEIRPIKSLMFASMKIILLGLSERKDLNQYPCVRHLGDVAMYKYFKNCQSFEEAKAMYKKLARENHPDLGGDTATMQEINAEWARYQADWTRSDQYQRQQQAHKEGRKTAADYHNLDEVAEVLTRQD